MKTWQIYLSAARPKTLTASLSPVFVGTTLALSEGFFSWLIFTLTLATALGIQICTNFANDYYDFIKGADTKDRKGPLRVMQAGLISLNTMKKAIMLLLLITAFLGAYLAIQGGIVIFVLLLLSLVLSLAYTGGPFPLAYLGLGDLFVFIFFGPVAVMGTYFLQTHTFNLYPALIGIGLGALSSEILSINNLRDQREDALSGKKTLIVRFGKTFGQIKYLLFLTLSALIPFVFLHNHPLSLLSLFFIPFAIRPIHLVLTYKDPRELNTALVDTGKLLFLYAILFSLGWLI